MLKLIISTIVILPWICLPIAIVNEQFRLPKEVFLIGVFMSMIALAIKNGLKFNYRNKYLSWLAFYVFFTVIMNWYFPQLFSINNEVRYNIWTIAPTINFTLGLVAVFLILSSLDKDDFSKIAKYICLSGVMVSIYAIMQLTGFDPMGKVGKYTLDGQSHFSALLDNPNLVGNYLALCVPFFFVFKQKKYLIGLPIVVAGVILSESSMSIVSMLVGVFIFTVLFFQKKRKFLLLLFIILIAIITALALNTKYGDFAHRDLIWGETLTHIKDNPMFGQGLGIFKVWEIHPPITHRSIEAHNDWLERWCELGLVGLFLISLILLNAIRNFNYREDNKMGFAYFSSFIIFFIIMCGSFPMEIAPLAFLGMINFSAVEKF